MANFFRNKIVKNVGTAGTTILDNTNNSKLTIIGLSLANVSESNLFVSVTVTDDQDVEGYYLKDVTLPPNSSLRVINGGEKLILANDNQLKVISNLDDSIDVVLSYVEIL